MRIDWWRVHDIAFKVALHSMWLIVQFVFTGFAGLLCSDFLLTAGAIIAATGTAVMLIAIFVWSFAGWMAGPPSRLC